MNGTKTKRRQFDRKKCLEILDIENIEKLYGNDEVETFYKKEKQAESDAVISKEIDDALVNSAIYLSEIIEEKGYSMRDLALLTGIAASAICRTVGTGKAAAEGKKYKLRRFVPWTSGETMAADIFGMPCSEFYMGENSECILLKRFVPILEALRTSTAQERTEYLAVINKELAKAKQKEGLKPKEPNIERKSKIMAERIEDLAGDRYASRYDPSCYATKSGKLAMSKICQYADELRNGCTDGDRTAAPITINSIMRTTIFADEPIDFLISDRYLRYLDAVYFDKNGVCRKVPEKEMRWLSDAVALSRETCIEFCSSVLAQILKAKLA